MKNIITLLLLTTSIVSFAQKMKVKNDQIVFDKNAVANFTREKGVFTLSSIDNSAVFTITVNHCALTGKFYLEYTNVATQVKNQKPLTSYSTMNEKKYVSLAIEEAGFVSPEGFQKDQLNAFIEGEKFDLAGEYGCTLINEGKEKLVAMNIVVLNNGIITKGNGLEIGRVSRNVILDQIKYEDHTYKFYNPIGELVATATAKMTSQTVRGTLITYDNKTFDIPLEKYFSSVYTFSKDDNVKMIVLILLQNGYKL